mmetsp:Transcript_33518/g.94862  ORF Transcript_33518/g.94862 Transcript_33518/m.94862 type:complete len:209 (+) Transcript_33518:313-939(+)
MRRRIRWWRGGLGWGRNTRGSHEKCTSTGCPALFQSGVTSFSFSSRRGTPPLDAAARSSRLTPLQLLSSSVASFTGKPPPGREAPPRADAASSIALSMASTPSEVTALPDRSAVTRLRQPAIASTLRSDIFLPPPEASISSSDLENRSAADSRASSEAAFPRVTTSRRSGALSGMCWIPAPVTLVPLTSSSWRQLEACSRRAITSSVT